MIKFIIKLLIFAIAVFFSILLQMIVGYLLPFPFSSINSILAISLLYLLLRENGAVLWFSISCFYILDILNETTFFGIIFLSGSLSIYFSIILYQYVFTNRSWYSATVLGILSVLIYRILYLILLYFATTLKFLTYINWQPLLFIFFWELLTTTFFVTIFYIGLKRTKLFIKKNELIFN
jgi:hypothetical protein